MDAGREGRIAGAEMNKQKRLDAIALHRIQEVKDMGILSKRDLMMLGLGLYWGESVKSRNGSTALVNSDLVCYKLASSGFKCA